MDMLADGTPITTAYTVDVMYPGTDKWTPFVAYPTEEARDVLWGHIQEGVKQELFASGEFRKGETAPENVSEGVRMMSNGYLRFMLGEITEEEIMGIAVTSTVMDMVDGGSL